MTTLHVRPGRARAGGRLVRDACARCRCRPTSRTRCDIDGGRVRAGGRARAPATGAVPRSRGDGTVLRAVGANGSCRRRAGRPGSRDRPARGRAQRLARGARRRRRRRLRPLIDARLCRPRDGVRIALRNGPVLYFGSPDRLRGQVGGGRARARRRGVRGAEVRSTCACPSGRSRGSSRRRRRAPATARRRPPSRRPQRPTATAVTGTAGRARRPRTDDGGDQPSALTRGLERSSAS